jgi:phospholipid/cholesterol/gamma-HCH transport system permease protein
MATLTESLGRKTVNYLDYVRGLSTQLWDAVRAMGASLPIVGNHYRWKASVGQMLQIGVSALPMVGLMAMCSGFILAMQGASELRRFGALHYVIDLVAVGFTREMGPLLTAIAVSGRSGSAFAAEIGTMSVTEEIDALRVMAFEPVEFVLAPKYLAALVMVPCLTVTSNVCGILAGGIFMFFTTHLSLGLYLHYVLTSIQLRDVISGLIKSLAFATIIVHVGCLEGFRVHGGPDAVGRSTTTAVVKSTFLVIVADVIFTAIFYYFTGKP